MSRRKENLVRQLLKASNTNKGITLIDRNGDEEFISYKQLYQYGYRMYGYLKEKGLKDGDELVFQFSDLKSFIITFWGSIIGKYIAVPIPLTDKMADIPKMKNIIDKLNRPYLITDNSSLIGELDETITKNLLGIIEYDENQLTLEVEENLNDYWIDDVAYIQFSSGSTGQPKGAMITHKNIIANVLGIIERFECTVEDRFLTWMPITHDFSIIMFHILPIILGCNQYYMEPKDFVRNPLMWVEKASKHRATVIATPPFGLKHLLTYMNQLKEKRDWNLECIRAIGLGAEYISYNLCNEFYQKLAEYGLKKNVLVPVYGLAEATLLVTTIEMNEELKAYDVERSGIEVGEKVVLSKGSKVTSFVSLGKLIPGMEVRICNESGQEVEDFTIGEIRIKGESVISGYYNAEDISKNLFDEEGWLCTGDIGFMANKELVMLGRMKEMVSMNGIKYSCNDIEQLLVEKLDKHSNSLEFATCTGFNNDTQQEKIVLFVRYTGTLDAFLELEKRIKALLFEESGLLIEYIIPIEQMPKTLSNKIQRNKLSQEFNAGRFKDILDKLKQLESYKEEMNVNGVSKKEVLDYVNQVLKEILQIDVVENSSSFKELGIVSKNIPYFTQKINDRFNANIQVVAVFEYPIVSQYIDYVYNALQTKDEVRENIETENITDIAKEENRKDIAIVGMSCRFPAGGNSPDEFWNVLKQGKDGIVDIPEDRWDLEKYYSPDKTEPGKMYTQKGGFLDHPINEFDPQFFNMSPKEASAVDPQQRLLLELTWEAFENANINISELYGENVGVYIGISTEEYSLGHYKSGDLTKVDAYSLTGTAFSTACGRISYTYGFTGPCFCVDTACSSSLTALNQACKAIQGNEAKMAVVGGVNLILSPVVHVGFSKLQAISPDGYSKSFDADASGYARAEGGGMIVLKTLEAAQRDGDEILGVIRGTAINQDGRSNGLTAPSGLAQEAVIRKALKDANMNPLDIDYVEMHGTGTKLGDPIEVNAVGKVYAQGRSKDRALKIGSVKSNIGHLEPAAGMASIIKVLLSLKHDMIPSNLHFNTPNPYIPWEEYAIQVVDKNTEFKRDRKPRCVGVNGFGFGGSNAHVIIQEAPKKQSSVRHQVNEGYYNLKVSAKSSKSLINNMSNFRDYIRENTDTKLEDIIYTNNSSRTDFSWRTVVSASNREELVQRLTNYIDQKDSVGVCTNLETIGDFNDKRQVVFLFTGQGSQYVGMGKSLYETNPVFKQAVDECNELFKPYILMSLTDLIYTDKYSEDMVNKTVYAQPLIFTIEYAMCKVLSKIGIKPDKVIGHSIGEYAAAVAGGVMTLEDAVKLVAVRGRLMDSAPGEGAMLAVFCDEDTLASLMKGYEERVCVAVYNAKNNQVLSGEKQAIDEIERIAKEREIKVSRLHVSHAFHSSLMTPILQAFREISSQVEYAPAQVEFISTALGRKVGKNEILDAEYWTNHIAQPVRFYESLSQIEDKDNCVFVEVGAHKTLMALCKLTFGDECHAVYTMERKKDANVRFNESIAELYCLGVKVDWTQFKTGEDAEYSKVSLPNYAYDKATYWVKPIASYKNDLAGIALKQSQSFIGEKIESYYLNNGLIYQNNFTSQYPYFMQEHVIFNTSISPAAAHMSMMISANRDTYNNECCTLENIEFHAPLAIVAGEERTVQVYLNDVDADQVEFELMSKNVNSSEWIKHCQGKLERNVEQNHAPMKIGIEELKNRYSADTSGFDVYKIMEDCGFELGEGFKGIKKIWRDGDRGVCLIEPVTDIPDINTYDIYPGIIDSAFQILVTTGKVIRAIDNGEKVDSFKTFVPISIAKFKYYYKPAKQYWCHIVADNSQQGGSVGDIQVYNENGELVLEVEKLMAKLTDRDSLLKQLNSSDRMLYTTKWKEQRRGSDYIDNNKCYVILAEHEDLYSKVAEGFAKFGAETINISVKEDIAESLKKLVQELPDKQLDVVYVAADDGDRAEDMDAQSLLQRQERDCTAILTLVQTISAMKDSKNISLSVITQDAVQGNGKISTLSTAALWGFAQVIKLENAKCWNGIIDINKSVLDEEVEEVLYELNNKEEKQVCLRNGRKRYVPRLVKETSKESNRPVTVNEEGTYLITGGTGGIGLLYAGYLVEKGAKNIVLLSRRTPEGKVAEQISEWKEMGVEIKNFALDISDTTAFEGMLKEISITMPPVKGIVHTAGVINDKMIKDLSWEDFEKVFRSKVMGAFNIHRAFQEDTLDFFIMMSSITAVVGNMGQANYAAANYFMNQLAAYRNERGLAATTICWGPWSEIGMASHDEKNLSVLEKRGIYTITPKVGKQVIDKLFSRNTGCILAADVNWNTFSNEMQSKEMQVFLQSVIINKQRGEGNSASKQEKIENILEELKGMSTAKRYTYTLEKLKAMVAKIMGYASPDLVGLEQALADQGADSLMMFSIRNQVNKMFDLELDMSVLFNYGSLKKLTNYLLTEALVLDKQEEVETDQTNDVDSLLEEINSLLK